MYGYIYRTLWVESTTQLKLVVFNSKKNDSATVNNAEFWIQRVLPLFRKKSDDEAHLVYIGHDNGEMASSKVQKLLASARVVSRHTDPYTPQQNGMAERANRYLDDDYPSSDRVIGSTKRHFPSSQVDGSEILDEQQRRRSSRLRGEPIPRAN